VRGRPWASVSTALLDITALLSKRTIVDGIAETFWQDRERERSRNSADEGEKNAKGDCTLQPQMDARARIAKAAQPIYEGANNVANEGSRAADLKASHGTTPESRWWRNLPISVAECDARQARRDEAHDMSTQKERRNWEYHQWSDDREPKGESDIGTSASHP